MRLELNKLIRKVRSIVSRSVVRAIYDDKKGEHQKMQLSILKNETRNEIERFQEYGFSSIPHEGSDAIVLFSGGNRENGIIVSVADRRYRLTDLKKGEVAIYSDEGDQVVFRRGNKIEFKTKRLEINADESVNIESKELKFKGKAIFLDDVKAKDFIADGVSLKNHKHLVPPDQTAEKPIPTEV